MAEPIKPKIQEVKGVFAHFECLTCGATHETQQMLRTVKANNKFSFEAPRRCAKCGGHSFILLSFTSASGKLQFIAD
jgi:NAD-dependent SIR2 family protein deacetylase